MEHAFALVVLSLLQLCQGQKTQPEWFAANLVNDPSFTPKPITEIFTSDSPFTSKNPALFTQPTTGTTSTLPPTSRPTPNAPEPQNATSRPLQNGGVQIRQTPEIMSQVAENPPNNDLPNFLIVFDPRGQLNQNIEQAAIPSSPPTMTQTTVVPNRVTTPTATSSTSQSTTAVPATQATLPPFQPGIPPQILSTLSAPAWPRGSVLVYPIQFPGVNTNVNSTVLPVTSTAVPSLPAVPPNSFPRPLNSTTQSLKSRPVLTVRVKAPRGSITNIHINPTTTVRPTTTKRRKSTRKTNNYDGCVNSCKGRKEPICSTPTGVNPINPNTLKGFPSLCHMACHNSFRKELYEKVTDGRCGKLRTRIRPVDKKKLNREELNKAQYTIVHNAPETVVEFSPVSSLHSTIVIRTTSTLKRNKKMCLHYKKSEKTEFKSADFYMQRTLIKRN
ncbi:jg5816 [Pararge aegeria aegeria]|uniref:Jg5816 protein n=1 Tax=Pararge aegeria aegeria TaxID=348720 RepID=A0A8S4RB86_9NEOP|nr:jg5816 [Pararge aegeria aegeria]